MVQRQGAQMDIDLRTQGDLERELVAAMERGAWVDRRTGDEVADEVANGEQWGQERAIPAEAIYEALTGAGGFAASPARSLRLAGVRITGSLDLEAAELRCPVVFRNCWFDGPLNLREAVGRSIRFVGTRVPEIDASQLKTSGDLAFSGGSVAQGEVRLIGAHIGGQLICSAGTFDNPGGVALSGDRLTIDQDMFCTDGFTARGEVRLNGLDVRGQLACIEAAFDNPGGGALILERASIKASIFIREARVNGKLSLIGASTGYYCDDKTSWPLWMDVDGFTYDDILGTDTSLDDRLQWIRLQPAYSPLPYEQLAGTYRRHGQDAWARTVAIAKQRHRRTTLPHWRRVGSFLLDATVGYGYRPWLAGGWLLFAIAVGALLTDRLDGSHIERARGTATGFNSLVYALDQTLPIVDLGQIGNYVPHGPAVVLDVTLVILGWALTSVFLLALTGVIKKD